MLAHVTISRDRTAAHADLDRCNAMAVVRAELERPDSDLDYARAKVAFDQFIDPSADACAVFAHIDQLAKAARRLARHRAKADARLIALRRTIYEAGPWNGGRPFVYDQTDPLGHRMENKLLQNYLANRLGQCVSMPILFLILGERLGLDVALAAAPEHLFVRYTDFSGRTINLETTSGAHPARLEWFRLCFPISDRALETGIYMRSLNKREAIAAMALTIVENLRSEGRYEEVIAVSKLVLAHDPSNVAALLWIGSASGKLLDNFRNDFPQFWKWSPAQTARAEGWMKDNRHWFSIAEHLGWQPTEEGGP